MTKSAETSRLRKAGLLIASAIGAATIPTLLTAPTAEASPNPTHLVTQTETAYRTFRADAVKVLGVTLMQGSEMKLVATVYPNGTATDKEYDLVDNVEVQQFNFSCEQAVVGPKFDQIAEVVEATHFEINQNHPYAGMHKVGEALYQQAATVVCDGNRFNTNALTVFVNQ